MIDKTLLDLLACPLCKSELELDGERLVCSHDECGCRYPVEEDIPVALIQEADRPCPECGKQRDWNSNENTLSCPACGQTFEAESS